MQALCRLTSCCEPGLRCDIHIDGVCSVPYWKGLTCVAIMWLDQLHIHVSEIGNIGQHWLLVCINTSFEN